MNRIILVILVFYGWNFHAQQSKVDSLKNLLNIHKKQDIERADLFCKLADSYLNVDPDAGLKYADSAIKLSRKLNDMRLHTLSYQAAGEIFAVKGESPKALEYFEKSAAIAMGIKNQPRLAEAYHGMARMHSNQGNYKKAIALELKALKIANSEGRKKQSIPIINSIGSNYYYLADYDKAIEYYFKALKLAQKMNNEKLTALSYENIALIYKSIGNTAKAYDFYAKSLELYRKLNHVPGLLNVYTNYGAAKDQANDPSGALDLYEKGLALARQSKNRKAEYHLLTNVAISQLTLKRYREALENLKKSIHFYKEGNDVRDLAIASQYYADAIIDSPEEILERHGISRNDKYNIAISYVKVSLDYCIDIGAKDEEMTLRESLSKLYEKTGNYRDALYQHRLYSSLKDSIFGIENKEYILQKEHQYEIEKTQLVGAAQVRKQKVVKLATVGVSSVILIAGLLLFIGYRKRQTIKHRQQELLLRAEISDIELKALRLQMNPHFIFNSLNSISDYIQKNNSEKADYFLSKFAKLMRGILENSELKEIPLSEEIKMLEAYMALESSRLKDKFVYEFKIDDSIDIDNTFIPPLILQPFVENSIWHGIAKKEGTGKIIIEVNKDDTMLNCIVEDNGVGRNGATNQSKSYGMKITRDRLEILNKINNTNASIHLVDLEKGTRVEVKLPLGEENTL